MIETFKPTKLQELMVQILTQLHREIGAIEFAKIIYLIDHDAIRFLGESITGQEYHRDNNGPLVENFYTSRDQLKDYEINIQKHSSRGNSTFEKHGHILGNNLRFVPEFTKEVIVVINKSLDMTWDLSPKQLEDLAYSTLPMQSIINEENKRNISLRGTLLDLSLINRNDRFRQWKNKKSKKTLAPKYLDYLREQSIEFKDFIHA